MVFMDSRTLFDVARKAAECLNASPKRQYAERQPLVAAVFSALSSEAFINEVFRLCTPPSEAGCPVQPLRLSELWCAGKRLEAAHASTLEKFQQARKILKGKAYNKGRGPFQDFKLLFDVRSAIVHVHPLDETELVWDRSTKPPTLGSRISKAHPILDKLRSRKLTVVNEHADSWIYRISTPALAKWACNTAACIIHSVANSMPKSYTKDVLGAYCSQHYQPV